MRGLRTSLLLGGLLGLSPALVHGQLVEQLMGYRPVVKQIQVDYDIPTDPKAIEACKGEYVAPAYLLRDGQGKILRRFARTGRSKKVDQWSYYQDGFEVYREADIDGKPDKDGQATVDEARWLNGGGTRIAAIVNNKIVAWKRISAEEASKVLVQAVAGRDLELLATVMATPEELASLGLPDSEVARIKQAEGSRAEAIEALWKTLVGWTRETTWLRLDAAMPHLIPADAAAGLKGDVVLYENAVVWAAPPNGGDPTKTAFLQATELVKIGDAWKFVDLPRAINPAGGGQPMVAIQGGIRSAVFGEAAGAPAENPALAKAIKALADFDNANGDRLNNASKEIVAATFVERIGHLRGVVKACVKPEDVLANNKQIVDCLANAYQTGKYPAGLGLLIKLEAEGDKLGSYAAYRRLNAEFNLESDNPNANVVAVQKKWMNDMKDFLAKYARSDEAPDVLFQLASNSEFNAEDAEAKGFYNQLVASYPATLPGKKAAGALRRHDLVGKPLVLKGTDLEGQAVDLAQHRGKTVLVAFWGSWSPPVMRDLPEIVKIYEKDKAKGFEVVVIGLDNDAQAANELFKGVPKEWARIFEPGNLESRLAVDFGIMSVPTMFLVDPQGKVINRNIRSSADLDIQLDKAFAAKSPVALGVKE